MLDRVEGFDAERFLADYWRQRPCLIRGWLKPQAQPLAPMLKLADELELPSRLVTGNQQAANWSLDHGPILAEDLPESERDWTVLVQEMDKASPEVAELLEAFRFLPDWMLDDIMISQAADGGSVGAHVDAYDVFLVQAAGQRRWQLAADYDPRLDERFELALLAEWRPQIELLAEPGDVLYLPAGIAHHGVAVGECQTWSVGLRTPSGPETLFFLAEALMAENRKTRRLNVAHPNPKQPSLIDAATVDDLRQLLNECLALDDRKLGEIAARMLSSWRLWHGSGNLEDIDQARRHLAAGLPLKLAPTTRLALTRSDTGLYLYVNGEAIDCPSELGQALAASRTLDSSWLEHDDALEQLVDLGAIAALMKPRIVR